MASLAVGDDYVLLPPDLFTAMDRGQPPPAAALSALLALRDDAHPELLKRTAQLGTGELRFELAPLAAWKAWQTNAGASFSGVPLVRSVEKQPDGTLSVSLRPLLLRVEGAVGVLLCSPRASPSEVLTRVHAALGGAAPPRHRLRLWLVGGGTGGAPPPDALFAGARALEEWLGEEELTTRVCARALRVETRREDGSWPRGDTTRAVRARELWLEAARLVPGAGLVPETPPLVPKDPLRNLCEFKDPRPAWNKEAKLFEVLSVFEPGANFKNKDGKLVEVGYTEDDGYFHAETLWNKSSWDALMPPLEETPAFRSRLRVGDAVWARVAPPAAGLTKAALVWSHGWVADLDHGAYPPTVSLAFKGAKKPMLLSLESAVIDAGKEADAAYVFPRPEGLAAPAVAPFLERPTLAPGDLPPIPKAACAFPKEEGAGGSLSSALVARADDAAGRAEVLDAFLAPLQEGLVDTYRSAWASTAKGGGTGMHGLQNLGNTCFMNSILQCLSSVEPMSRFFLRDTVALQAALSEANEMSYGGRIALAWAAFIRAQRQNTGGETLVPRVIKDLVSEKASHFVGFQQHDSEEFARFLLDYLMEDTTRHKGPKKPVVPYADTDAMTEAELARNEWHSYQLRNGSPVTDLFAGSYLSEVKCLTCGNVAKKCDPFTSLQVPLAPSDAVKSFSFLAVDAADGWITTWTLYFEPGKTGPLTAAQLCAWLQAERALRETEAASPAGAKRVGQFLSAEVAATAQALVDGTASTNWVPAQYYNPQGQNNSNADRMNVHRLLSLSEDVQTLAGNKYVPLLIEVPQLPGSASRANGGLPPPGSYAIVTLRCSKKSWGSYCFPIYHPFAVALPPGASGAQAADAVFARMVRFMSPTFKADYSAEDAPYTLLRCVDHPAPTEHVPDHPIPYLDLTAASWLRTHRLRTGAAKVPYSAAPLGAHCSLMVDAPLDGIKQEEFPAAPVTDQGTPMVAWSVHLQKEGRKPPQKPQSLESCLARNEEGDVMRDVNQVYCRKCKEHRDCEKKMRVWRLPPILLIQLKRYSRKEGYGGNYGGFYSGGTVTKNSAVVTFPPLGLDMARFAVTRDKDELALPEVARPPAWEGGPAPQPQPTPDGKLLYDLFAVSQHSGSLTGGHYTAAAQDWETGRWHALNDSSESNLSGSPARLADASAYVLFYRRRDTEGKAVLEANLAAEAGAAASGGGGGGGGGGEDYTGDEEELM
jgi:ubiquitin C-terminal hydrolase